LRLGQTYAKRDDNHNVISENKGLGQSEIYFLELIDGVFLPFMVFGSDELQAVADILGPLDWQWEGKNILKGDALRAWNKDNARP
jgi:hypothetical protein